MPISFGSAAISSLAVGSTAVSKVCLGANQAWPACTPSAMLLHFDGSNGSASITDSSANAATATAYGSAAISTSQSKFGGSSLYLDGSSSGRVTVADYTGGACSFSGDFTVEAWVYPISAASYRTIATRYNGSNDAWLLRFDGTGTDLTSVAWYSGSATGSYYNFAATIPLNQWHHVAVTRQGTSVKCFLNGAQIGSTQTNGGVMTGGSAGTMIGASDQSGYEFPFDGYIDDFRIVDGLAVYQGPYTPPSSALAACASAAPALPTVTLHYMVVGGGGAGGVRGGGGGAGGYREGTGYVVSLSTALTVTVGAGGASVAPPYYNYGNNGNDSTFDTITSAGGGGGGGFDGAGTLGVGGPGMLGQDGGSGGGGGVGWYASGNPGSGNVPPTTPSQGNNGGTGVNVGSATTESPGGGGGAGGVGADGSNAVSNGGDGGPGAATAINNGTPWAGAEYAGGGGGGANPGCTAGPGGSGGGGSGSSSGAAGDGNNNSGGGGGGCSYNSGDSSGNGGSGFVAIRTASTHAISVGPGLSYFSVSAGSDTIHCFTAGSDTISFTS